MALEWHYYFLLCELQRRGIDGVFEQYGARRRTMDFRLGQSLGSEDHLIELKKACKKTAVDESNALRKGA
jgi:hypothetical protein